MKKRITQLSRNLHPLLMVLYPILQFYSHNINELRLPVLLRPLIFALSLTLILWLLLARIGKIRQKVPILLTLGWFFVFSHGHISGFFFGQEAPLLAEIVYGLIFLGLVVMIVRSSSTFPQLGPALSTILLVLVLIPLVNTVQGVFRAQGAQSSALRQATRFPEELVASLQTPPSLKDKPDIYFLIFDRYASSNSLKQFLGFNNQPFEKKLKKDGFFVARRSMANYPATFLSLASSLNMSYIDESLAPRKSQDKTFAYGMIKNAIVPRYLKALGYRTIHIGSWWEATRANPDADRNIPYTPNTLPGLSLNEFEIKLLSTTWLDLPLRRIQARRQTGLKIDPQQLEASRVLNQIQAVIDSTREEGPKFVFCHFLLTHPPYYFAADGTINSLEKSKITDDPQIYLDSIRYANRRILDILEAINRNSGRDAVVIIQADEGPYSTLIKPDSEWENPYSRIRFRSQIINAMRIPGVTRDDFYHKISPVNTFRLVFNQLFGTALPILKDKTLLSVSPKDLYSFKNIAYVLRKNLREYLRTGKNAQEKD